MVKITDDGATIDTGNVHQFPGAGQDAKPRAGTRPLDEAAALDWLRNQPDGRTTSSAAELGRGWGWPRYRVSRQLQRWKNDRLVTQRGRTRTAAHIKSPKGATNGLEHLD